MTAKKQKLTPKQQKFVIEYLRDGNATQAAIRSGYSKRSAYSTGDENLRKPVIADAIAKAQAKTLEKLGMDVDEVLKELSDIARTKLPADAIKPVDKLSALDKLGKHLGMFKEVHEHKHEHDHRTITEMSDDELRVIARGGSQGAASQNGSTPNPDRVH